MNKFINEHSIKIQLGMAVGVLMTLMYWSFTASGFVARVENAEKAIEDIRPQVNKIPVIESNVNDIRDDLSEIKQDIKTLLKR